MSFALMLPHGEPYVAAGYTAARPSSPERKILRAGTFINRDCGRDYYPRLSARFIASYARKSTLVTKSRHRGRACPSRKGLRSVVSITGARSVCSAIHYSNGASNSFWLRSGRPGAVAQRASKSALSFAAGGEPALPASFNPNKLKTTHHHLYRY